MSSRSLRSIRAKVNVMAATDDPLSLSLSPSLEPELKKIVSDCDLSCQICSDLIRQLSQHVQGSHQNNSVKLKTEPNRSKKVRKTVSNTANNVNLELKQEDEEIFTPDGEVKEEDDDVEPTNKKPKHEPKIRESERVKKAAVKSYTGDISDDESEFILPDIFTPSGDDEEENDDEDYNEGKCVKKRSKKQKQKPRLNDRHLTECGICGSTGFPTPEELMSHITSVHPKTGTSRTPVSSPCKVCGKTLANLYQLIRHSNRRGGPPELKKKSFDCTICSKSFKRHKLLREHVKVKHTEKKEKSVKKKRKFKKNPDSDEVKEVKVYECSHCHKKFASQQNLRAHLTIHSEIKPHECATCHKKFGRKSHLTEHARTHSDMARHICEECGNAYKTKNGLDAHKMKHKGKKPFMCATCGKCFVGSAGLANHALTHKTTEDGLSQLKPFQCPNCPAKFVRREFLARHSWIHTGIKPHECTTCGQRFTQSHTLKTHRIKAHGGEIEQNQSFCQKDENEEDEARQEAEVNQSFDVGWF